MAKQGEKNDSQGVIHVPGRANYQFQFMYRGEAVRFSTGVLVEFTKDGSPTQASWLAGVAKKASVKAEIDARLDRAEREKATGIVEGKTLLDALTHYRDKVAKRGGDFKQMKSICERIAEGLGSATLLRDLTEEMIEGWRDQLQVSGKKAQAAGGDAGVKAVSGQGLKASTINLYLQKLRTVLNLVHRKGWMTVVPEFEEVEEGHEVNVEFITREQFADLLAAAAPKRGNDPRLQQFLRALVGTGARWKSEGLALSWKDLDLVSNHGGVVTFTKTKSKKPRSVPISDELRDMFVAMKLEQQKVGFGRPDDKVFMFKNQKGEWKAWKNPTSSFERARRDAGISEDITLHNLRHTYASWMVQKGGLKVIGEVSEMLGHSSTAITKKVYAHVTVEHLRSTAALLVA